MEKRRRHWRDTGRFSGTTSKLKFSFVSRVLAPSRRDGAMLIRFQGREGRVRSSGRFNFTNLSLTFRFCFAVTWHTTTGPRLTGCETVSVTDSLRPPDRFAPSIVSQSNLSTHQKREREREKEKRTRLSFTWPPTVRTLLLRFRFLTLTMFQSNLENSFLSV